MRLIRGGRPDRPVVCTWCADRFLDRHGLLEHWAQTPICFRNRFSVSPDKPAEQIAGLKLKQPGQHVLDLVRSREP